MSVDSRIVTMKFDNKQFQEGAATTMSTLDKLKSALGFSGASKGLDQVQASADKMHFGGLEGGITKVSASFAAMATIAITALSNITSKAMATGASVVKSLTIAPIKGGFDEYELKMGSIQTIMAGSGESLEVVNKKLQELNEYSDKTIYSFKDMTSNIGKFTNAGVSLEKSVGAIQGIANVAAISGANADEASRAMYNFAQSISAGSVKLMDWKSIELANMATKEFKTQLMDSAVAAGTLKKDAKGLYTTLEGTPVSATKGFNESLSEQWLTSEALVKTLGDYASTETDIGRRATAAASDVKTFSQMMDTMKESAGSGWATTSELIFGNFEEAKKLWTGVNDVLGGMIGSSADARNKVLGDWKALGGRTVLIEGIKNAFEALMMVVAPIKRAFREFFPAKTGFDLMKLTNTFRDFTEKLKIGVDTASDLKYTFKGVFAILSIAKMLIGGVIGVIMDLIGSVSGGAGGFLDFTAGIGKWLVKVERALRTGQDLTQFFDGLGKILLVPITILKELGKLIANVFSGAASSGSSPLQAMIDSISNAISGIPGMFGKAGEALKPAVDKFVEIFGTIGQRMAESFSGENFDRILSMVNTGLFGGLVLLVKRFLDGGGIFGKSGIKNMFDSVASTFGALTGQMQAMQKNVKADTMMKIAAAVGILTVSIVALSLIDSDKLVKSLSAIGVSFGMLLGAMAILDKIGKSGGFLKMPFITASMISFSIAILILTAAVKNLSELNWTELGKGLAGVAGLMAILAVAVKPLSASSGGMISAGVGILALSVGLKVLATVVEDFGTMEWGVIGKGLAGVAGGLTVIAATMRLMPKNMVLQAVSIGILAGALKILANVVADFGAMDWGTIGKGLAGIGLSLVVISGAMWAMPPNMVLTAASLVLVAIALQGVARALGTMGGMSWDEISMGLKALAGSLIILAAGLYLMSGSLAGSAALLVAAGALAIFTPVLKTLGTMPWDAIIKGLVAIAGVFLIVGIAGLALSPVIPVIVLLGLSLLAIGAGLALAGAGALAFATALGILVSLGAAVTIMVGNMLATIIKQIPAALRAFGEGVILFAVAIAKGAPAFIAAMTTVLNSIMKAVSNAIPKLAALFLKMLATGLSVIVRAVPMFATAGLKILLGLLHGIADNLPKIVTVVVTIITRFINAIANNLPRIVKSGSNLIGKFIDAIADEVPKLADQAGKAVIRFVNGIATAIRNNAGELRAAGRNLAGAIIDGMTGGLASKAGDAINAAKDVASRALGALKGVFNSNSPSKETFWLGEDIDRGLALGILKQSRLVNTSVTTMGDSALVTMRSTMEKISDAAMVEIDSSPVIAPVLDLTQLQKDAAKIGSMINTNPLTAGVSFNQASSISADSQALQTSSSARATQTTPAQITFEQNNYSPKALSPVDVYRQTKNQLSLAKEALKV